MSLTYTSPISEIREQINRIFSDFNEEPMLPSLLRSELPLTRLGNFLPPLEVTETEKDVIVRAALPCIKQQHVNLEVAGHTLIISGECRRENRQDEKQFHRSEFQYGTFMRKVLLPEYARNDAATAEFRDGILEVHVPKMEES